VPIERSWEILRDFQHVQKIHSLVETVDQVSPDTDRGVGAVRICNLYDGNKATECIRSWDEANRTYTVRLIDGSLPMKSVDIVLKAEDAGSGKSKLVADMDLKGRYGLLGKVMEHLVIKPQLGGAIGYLFAGLGSYDENGVEKNSGVRV